MITRTCITTPRWSPALSTISGFYAMPPSHVKRMQNLTNYFNNLIQALGYDRWNFPRIGLLKDLQFEKNLLGIMHEVLKIDGGQYYLTPTGEAIQYPLYFKNSNLHEARWYTVGPAYRVESNATKYLIRHKEIQYFHETHAILSSRAVADDTLRILEDTMDTFLDSIGIAYIKSWRPKEDRFPGACHSLAYDAILRSGAVIQIATIHDLDTNFSKHALRPKYQVCMGWTERILGVLIDHYGPNLRDLDNPYTIITVKPKKGYTKKTVADSIQGYYQNQYTETFKNEKPIITHVNTNRIINPLDLDKDILSLKVKIKEVVMRQMTEITKKSTEQGHIFLGTYKGKLRYATQKL